MVPFRQFQPLYTLLAKVNVVGRSHQSSKSKSATLRSKGPFCLQIDQKCNQIYKSSIYLLPLVLALSSLAWLGYLRLLFPFLFPRANKILSLQMETFYVCLYVQKNPNNYRYYCQRIWQLTVVKNILCEVLLWGFLGFSSSRKQWNIQLCMFHYLPPQEYIISTKWKSFSSSLVPSTKTYSTHRQDDSNLNSSWQWNKTWRYLCLQKFSCRDTRGFFEECNNFSCACTNQRVIVNFLKKNKHSTTFLCWHIQSLSRCMKNSTTNSCSSFF